jgi:uncharacterized protein
MTNEERDFLASFVQRISGAGPAAPGQPPAALPPVEPEADQLLAELFTRFPEARYRMTQSAFIQEAALHQAQARIDQLQAEIARLQQAAQQAQAAPAQPSGRPSSFFGGLFGGAQPAQPPPVQQPVVQQPVVQQPPQANPWGQPAPQQAYAPPPQPYPQQPYPQQPAYPPQMQQGGPGFFGSALRTAAGVAGGMVLGNTLMNMFSGPHLGGMGGMGGMGGGFGGMPGGFAGAPVNETTIINNYNDAPPAASPWDNAAQQDPGWDSSATDQGWQDASDNDPGADFGGGGFDDSTDV